MARGVQSVNNEPILSSMLAAGIVLDTFAGEAGEGERGCEVEATSITRSEILPVS